MLIDPRINEQAVAIEKVNFIKTDRLFNPKKTDPFLYLPGTIPVLVSAPHAVRHIRRKVIKQSDIFTGAIVYLLHQLTGCHALMVTKLYGGDPNWDQPCIYKQKLSLIAAEQGIRLIIDLHGASGEHPFDAELGTMGGISFLGRDNLLPLIKKACQDAGLQNIGVDQIFSAAGQPTVTAYAAGVLCIPAVQIELNRRYRAPQQNGLAFHQGISALAMAIRDLNKVL